MKLVVGVIAAIEGLHEGPLCVRVAEPQGMAQLVSRHNLQVCPCNHNIAVMSAYKKTCLLGTSGYKKLIFIPQSLARN